MADTPFACAAPARPASSAGHPGGFGTRAGGTTAPARGDRCDGWRQCQSGSADRSRKMPQAERREASALSRSAPTPQPAWMVAPRGAPSPHFLFVKAELGMVRAQERSGKGERMGKVKRRTVRKKPRTRSPSPGGGGSASMSKANASRGGVSLNDSSPHPDAHFVRVDPPPPGEGGSEYAERAARHCGVRADQLRSELGSARRR